MVVERGGTATLASTIQDTWNCTVNTIARTLPVIREPDCLAMSSRNRLLSEKERKIAPEIAQTLRKAREKQDELSPAALKKWVTDTLNQHPEMQVDYFEIVDDQNLNPVRSWGEQVNKVGCVAVQLGAVRLIDNIYFH